MLSLRRLREDRSFTQQKIADYLGISKQAYSNYELAKRTPDIYTLHKLAIFYQIPMEAFFSENELPAESIKIPILSSAPAETAGDTAGDILGWEEIPKKMTKDNQQYYGLIVSGDSMYPNYLDGDLIIVLKQSHCDSGDDCIVSVNNESPVFKTVIKNKNGSITLRPINPAYPPHTYTALEQQDGLIHIVGVVVEARRKIK